MKICMVTSSYPRNDGDFAGVFVRSLAEALTQIGHDVSVLAAYDPQVLNGESKSQVKLHYFRYAFSRRAHVLGYARSLKGDAKVVPSALALAPVYLVSCLASLTRLHSKEKFDIIHAHWVIPCGAISALGSRLLGIPLVVSLHGSDVFVAERNKVYATIARTSFQAAHSVIACSDDLRNRAVILGSPKEKTATVPYGVNVEAFFRSPSDQQLRRHLNPSENGPVVLAAGRLVGKKGFEDLITAMPLILDQIPATRFAIIGDGDNKERLVGLARDLGVTEHVVFLGAVPWPQMPDYLSACDVFVVPSIHHPGGNVDGLPNTLLEAMAAGKPVVASAVGGIPQAISHGVDGLLVAEKSPDEIAAAVAMLLRSPQLSQRLGGLAQEKVRQRFSWEGVAQSYSRIYAEAVDAQQSIPQAR